MDKQRVLEFFFDIGSPYSYLAATVVGRVGERTHTHVWWRPFLLGGVFKASGNTAPARVQSKARWMHSDLERWAAYYQVPFHMSTHFPLNTLRTQRALVAAGEIAGADVIPELALGLFRAYWVDDRNVSTDEVIADVAAAAGLDAGAIIEAAGRADVKGKLRADTDEAVQRGAFGAPSFFVDGTLFWGNDRLMLIEAMLAQPAE